MEEQRLKLYAVGSTEISQFTLPLPDNGGEKPSHARRPYCISTEEQFDIPDQENANQDEPEYIPFPNPLLKESITLVVCGGAHTLLLTKKNQVFSFGSNDQGALGRKGCQVVPILVPLECPIDTISAGDCHSVFANKQLGLLYFCGVYRGIVKGQIGEKVTTPQQIELSDINRKHKSSKLMKVISGFNHTMVLVDQTIYIRGDIQYFALGRRFIERRKSEVKPSDWLAIGLKKVIDIWTGGMHCFAKIKKGSSTQLHAWGNNSFGQLGLGRRGEQTYPEKVTFFADMDIVKIVGGQHHTIFLNADGQVFSCGKNDVGQLGLGQDFQNDESDEQVDALMSFKSKPTQIQGLQNVVDIISGPHFSYAVAKVEKSQEHQVYSWGLSGSYVLLNGSEKNDKYQPYKILSKIINYQKIVNLSAGGQHIMYLAQNNPNPPPPEPVEVKNPPQKSIVPPQPQPPAQTVVAQVTTTVTVITQTPSNVSRKGSTTSQGNKKKSNDPGTKQEANLTSEQADNVVIAQSESIRIPQAPIHATQPEQNPNNNQNQIVSQLSTHQHSKTNTSTPASHNSLLFSQQKMLSAVSQTFRSADHTTSSQNTVASI